MEPLVTAIIPCYNHEKWVQDAILSIVNQDYKNKRIVVVDDGSTDESWKKIIELIKEPKTPKEKTGEPEIAFGILKESDVGILAAKFSKNYGPSTARNWAIQSSIQGTEYFALLDADDIYEPTKIRQSIEVFQEVPNCGIVYSDYTTKHIHTGFEQRQFKEPYSRARLLQECIINCDSVFSKKAFEVCGLFEPSLTTCEDLDFYLRVTENFLAVHLPLSLTKIRIGPHSSTNYRSQSEREANYRKVFERLHKRNAR